MLAGFVQTDVFSVKCSGIFSRAVLPQIREEQHRESLCPENHGNAALGGAGGGGGVMWSSAHGGRFFGKVPPQFRCWRSQALHPEGTGGGAINQKRSSG